MSGRSTLTRATALIRALRLTCWVLLLLAGAEIARAVSEVELDGRVVAVQGTTLTLKTDNIDLTLDVSDIDVRFLSTLQPGDDIRVTSFRLADGSLHVYNIFVHPHREEPPPPDYSQGGD
jgi:hypothetical protein